MEEVPQKTLTQRLRQMGKLIPEHCPVTVSGRLTRMVGLTLEAVGCNVSIGSRCIVGDEDNHIEAEVVGFEGERIYLMPVSKVVGLKAGARVTPVENENQLVIGDELLGRVVNGFGEPIDGKGALHCRVLKSLNGDTINPLHRQPIREPLDVGIKAINSFGTVTSAEYVNRTEGLS